MAINNSVVQESAQLIINHLELDKEALPVVTESNEADLLLALTRVVQYLLDNDFQRLLNGCYRIDLSEKHVARILDQAPPDEMAAKMAQLIIDREKQKVIIRRKYSQQG